MNELEAERAAEKARKAGVKRHPNNVKRSVAAARAQARWRGLPVPASSRNERRSKKIQARIRAEREAHARSLVASLRANGAALWIQLECYLLARKYEVPTAFQPVPASAFKELVEKATYNQVREMMPWLAS